MKPRVFGLTDIGRRRENNQDQLLVNDEIGVYAVADGMGGHAAGEVASQIAIEALEDAMSEDSWRADGASSKDIFKRLEEAFKEGNRRICESVITRGEWRGMGTTIVALVASGDRALIGHVGDSRAYLLRDGRLVRLTNDHSWVSEQVRLGLLTDEEAHKHPMRNIITRALGNREDLEVDVTEERFLPGDIFLLCSDGLSSMLSDDEIRRTLSEQAPDPEKACRELVDQANERGGEDNITVVVLAGGAPN
jgi:serine/threonine protein phosphatase PrpC